MSLRRLGAETLSSGYDTWLSALTPANPHPEDGLVLISGQARCTGGSFPKEETLGLPRPGGSSGSRADIQQ